MFIRDLSIDCWIDCRSSRDCHTFVNVIKKDYPSILFLFLCCFSFKTFQSVRDSDDPTGGGVCAERGSALLWSADRPGPHPSSGWLSRLQPYPGKVQFTLPKQTPTDCWVVLVWCDVCSVKMTVIFPNVLEPTANSRMFGVCWGTPLLLSRLTSWSYNSGSNQNSYKHNFPV